MVTRFLVNVGVPDERMESFLRGFFLRNFNPKNGMSFEEGILKVDLVFEEKPPEKLMETLIAYAGSGQIKAINYLPDDAPDVPDEMRQEKDSKDAAVETEEGLVAEAGLEETVTAEGTISGVDKDASEEKEENDKEVIFYLTKLPDTGSEEAASAEEAGSNVTKDAPDEGNGLVAENAPVAEDTYVEEDNPVKKDISVAEDATKVSDESENFFKIEEIKRAFELSDNAEDFISLVALLIAPLPKRRELFKNIIKVSKNSSKVTWRTIENGLKGIDVRMGQLDRNALTAQVNDKFNMQFPSFVKKMVECSKEKQKATVKILPCMPALKRLENKKFVEAFEEALRNVDKAQPIPERVYYVMHAMGNNLFDGSQADYNELIVAAMVDTEFDVDRYKNIKVRLNLSKRVNELAQKYDVKGKVKLNDFLNDLRSIIL